MLRLVEANMKDAEKQYEFIYDIPENENGYMNSYHGISKDEYINNVIPKMIENSKGINLRDGYVPQTTYFLWDDDTIVGLFRVRHYLNDALRAGAGHIGYGIKKQYRRKGYATKGLALTIEKAKEIIREDEIYMSCHIGNEGSLKAQLNNGAVIHHSDDKEYYTRIRIR